MTKLVRHLRSNLVACVALLVALSGTSYAASTKLLPRNSVGSAQVINRSLQSADLSKKALASLRGRQGPPGAQGPAGPPPAGPPGTPDTSNFYSKAQSDARFLGISAKAVDSDKVDGYDANGLVRVGVAGVHSGSSSFAMTSLTSVTITAPAAGLVLVNVRTAENRGVAGSIPALAISNVAQPLPGDVLL